PARPRGAAARARGARTRRRRAPDAPARGSEPLAQGLTAASARAARGARTPAAALWRIEAARGRRPLARRLGPRRAAHPPPRAPRLARAALKVGGDRVAGARPDVLTCWPVVATPSGARPHTTGNPENLTYDAFRIRHRRRRVLARQGHRGRLARGHP